MTIREALQILKPFKDCMIDQHGCPISDAAIALDVVIKELENKEWIPCSERLPYAEYGESNTVLTTCGYRDAEDTSVRWIRLLYFDGGNWVYPTSETYEAKVYAWMPLPDAWEGEKSDD